MPGRRRPSVPSPVSHVVRAGLRTNLGHHREKERRVRNRYTEPVTAALSALLASQSGPESHKACMFINMVCLGRVRAGLFAVSLLAPNSSSREEYHRQNARQGHQRCCTWNRLLSQRVPYSIHCTRRCLGLCENGVPKRLLQ